MPSFPRYLVLALAAAALAAAVVYLLPESVVRWIPAAVGAAWTVGLVWLTRRLGAGAGVEPGAWGARGMGAGIVACGLLTALAARWAVTDGVAWPELVLLSAALVAFGFWARALLREVRRRRECPPRPVGPVLGLREREQTPPDSGPWM
ncbi:MAG TPA: hypothetical protein VLT85_09365 [Terriglobales bacterium]|nr:hypothetical protein [Terriglobales bacterium]